MFLLLVGCPYVVDLTPKDSGVGETALPLDSAWSGDWEGSIRLDVDFESWEQEDGPYCSGSVWASVEADGTLVGGGQCLLHWGPSEGETLGVDLGGLVGDAVQHIDAVVMSEERGTEPRTLTVEGDSQELNGFADTIYRTSSGDPFPARLTLSLIHSAD